MATLEYFIHVRNKFEIKKKSLNIIKQGMVEIKSLE